MGEFVQLKAEDGNELCAYVAKPEGAARGAVVVVQEIFGINKHIQSVADSYAEQGYLAIAPALFDRIEKNVMLDYTPQDLQKAFTQFYPKLNVDTALLDVAAAYHYAAAEQKSVAVIGFCYGGLMAWISAVRGENVRMQPACCVGYYAGGIGNFATEQPSCPVMLHFGAEDTHIGPEQREAVAQAHPEVEIFVYEGAGHAFNRDVDPNSYHAEAARLARQRTDEFLAQNLA